MLWKNMDRKILAATLAATLLAGCAKAPDNVKRENDGGGERNDITSVQYIPTAELEADIESALSKSYSQFELGEGINVELPQKYCQASFTQAAYFEGNYEEIFARFFDEDQLADVEISSNENADGMKVYEFMDAAEEIYGCVGNNGFVSFVRPAAFENMFGGGKRVEIYHVDRKDDLTDSYLLDGENVSIQAAAELADAWIQENYADLEPDYEIYVKTVIVRENNGAYSYDIFASKKFCGTTLDDLVQVTDTSDKSGKKLKYATQDLYLQMVTGGEISSFTNGNGMLLPQEESELNKVASLSSALGYLENTFTDFSSNVTINDINLKYTLTPRNDYENGQSSYDAGVSVDSRLVWEFVIDVPEDEMPVGEEYSTAGNLQKFIYLDAENGELDYEFNISAIMQ